MLKVGRHKIGSIGVDSGQMMLCDPCYLNKWEDNEFDNTNHQQARETESYEFNYNGACAATLSPKRSGILGVFGIAAVCSTGYGDGCYDVFITVTDEREWGLRISKLEIVFIESEDK